MSDDEVLLTGWGRTSPSRARLVHPADAGAVATTVRSAGPRGLIARGMGRSYGDAAQNGGGLVLAPIRADARVRIDPDTAVVDVAAGVSVESLISQVLPHGLLPPVLPGTRLLSIGGAVAADVHGKNHHVDGSVGRHLTGLTLVDGTGAVRRLGPVDDSDAFWATVGGMGLTGVITEASIRCTPVQTSRMRVRTRKIGDLDSLFAEMTSSTARYNVAWVDCLAGRSMGRGVLDEGDHAVLDDLSGRAADDPLAYTPSAPVIAPPMPINPLRSATVRAFNAAWWAKAPRDHDGIVGLTRFFHPLDGVRAWNRLYGPAGFLQYQFVVPVGAEEVVRTTLRRLADANVAPFLAVLKLFGAGSGGLISFPQPGWTLAVDIAAGSDRLAKVLDELDELVVAAGGRIYLAKDSRLRPELLPAMYPELDRWRQVRARLDPADRFHSDLARRLGL